MTHKKTLTFGQRAFIALQYLLPHHLVSAIVYGAVRIRFRWWTRALIRWAVRNYDINVDEAAHGDDPTAYCHFNDFFTRELKPDARPMAPTDWICPADGCISQIGRIEEGQIFQAKGHQYSLAALLGANDDWADHMRGGSFATIYLSPRDYHRVHMPADGLLEQQRSIGGRLFSVAPLTVENIPGLFARNARRVSLFTHPSGSRYAVILVGAINVSSMETVWDDASHPPKIAKGDEMGRFNLGSTVIIVSEEDLPWRKELCSGQKVKVGEALVGQA